MRNANAQRLNIMVRPAALQQPLRPHVSHAETGGKVGRSKFAAAIARTGFGEAAIRKNANLESGRFSVQKFSRTGASETKGYEGQRCALLTTKSRNTCTRATVFNSSG
jgi:hypothetical protein